MKRTLPGLALAIGWLLLLLYGNFLLFWAVVALFGYLAAREYCRLVFPYSFYESERIILAVLLIFPVIAAVFAGVPGFHETIGLFLGFLGIISFVMVYYGRFENPLHTMAGLLSGLLFVGFLGSHVILIHALEKGSHWLLILTAVTATSDTCAYVVGSRWGKRKLYARISSAKTIEGAAGGVVGAIGAALLFALLFPVEAGFILIAALAVLLSLVGMVGDLLESLIKRGTGKKDSGTMLAGHGGVLDRTDSLLLAAPVLYYLLIYTGYR
ncbi:MAG: phosphatidate cytidylyltransferase [Desulfofustis sp. PB-SRB1]|jgi:phosphatidate cytidylyltransferase|nr:phosphatidate cytidylyltransferase [Desulfofustis sp. PB-SRB1]MBM1002425.1 phosphatidate cytidylyltransferase [Desulfofustis sp. PB-SRB1]HBH30041.1 phosphatidate cytidylyltransferase [Desulfofustis sp.]HBH31857.1 phosphatidate cytidylyltransferase [Desulfofustis sp.]